MSEIYTDAGGRRCLIIADKLYYLVPQTGMLMLETFTHSTDKQGRVWQTPHRRKVKNERIRKLLLADGAQR